MARGGYRKPANPAPVSGPGKLSRRTDGAQPVMEMTGGAYGERKALREMQGAAPMAQEAPMEMPKVTGLFEPTQRPAEPVTAGMPFGPGVNSVPNVVVPNTSSLRNTLEKILAVDSDPDIETLYSSLMDRGVI